MWISEGFLVVKILGESLDRQSMQYFLCIHNTHNCEQLSLHFSRRNLRPKTWNYKEMFLVVKIISFVCFDAVVVVVSKLSKSSVSWDPTQKLGLLRANEILTSNQTWFRPTISMQQVNADFTFKPLKPNKNVWSVNYDWKLNYFKNAADGLSSSLEPGLICNNFYILR